MTDLHYYKSAIEMNTYSCLSIDSPGMILFFTQQENKSNSLLFTRFIYAFGMLKCVGQPGRKDLTGDG